MSAVEHAPTPTGRADLSYDVVALLTVWAERSPEQVAIRAYDVAERRGTGELAVRSSLTVAALREQVVALGAGLRSIGITPGTTLALQVPNWTESIVTYLAATAVGAVVMPISTIYRGRDLRRQLALGQASLIVVPGRLGSRGYVDETLVHVTDETLPEMTTVVAIGDGPDVEGAVCWSSLLEAGRAAEREEDRRRIAASEFVPPPDALSLLNFTSGTTGEPKGVMHTAATVFSSGRALVERLELTEQDRFFVPATLGHAAGFLNGLYVPLALGATTVFMDVWDVTAALRIIEAERVTYGPAMPTYLIDISEHPEFDAYDISSWSRVRVSGGAIPRHVIAGLQERLPSLRLCPGWGMSEVLYATCGATADPEEKLATSDGRPLASASLRIRALDGADCAAGEIGEILVKGPSVTTGYYRREALTRAATTEDGWFRSGDLGFLDADGFLTIAGRSKELIIRGGENVPVVEVEHLLGEHPSVAGIAVVGLPDPRLGEKVCAVVELAAGRPPFTLADLREYLIERGLTRQFIPELLEIVDEIPRTSLGKLRKTALREDLLARRGLEQPVQALPRPRDRGKDPQ